MAITIIAVGKKHEDWIKDGVERYQKRLRAPYDITWELLPHSSYEDDRARQEESDRIADRLEKYEYVVLLDERGRLIDTPTISGILATQFAVGKKVALIIGGAFGVNDELRSKADMIWSLSPLVFPHQLVRLIVTEQIYRSQDFARGGKYHHV
jgi:23S rRNA (pseudouridine1915-N3)-methyltransferase